MEPRVKVGSRVIFQRDSLPCAIKGIYGTVVEVHDSCVQIAGTRTDYHVAFVKSDACVCRNDFCDGLPYKEHPGGIIGYPEDPTKSWFTLKEYQDGWKKIFSDEELVLPTTNLCNCDLRTIMCIGCQCGGV